MHRRVFLSSLAASIAAVPVSGFLRAQSGIPANLPADLPVTLSKHISRYRGFNIQWERRAGDNTKPAFEESDFAMMQEWGFNFARLPLSYWIWGKPTDWTYINDCLLYTSPSPRDRQKSRMPSSA